MELRRIKEQVAKIIKETPIADIHTHMYSETFGDLLLWGVDELLTYHYLIAELFRYKPELDYDTFWNMPKKKQAEFIWEEMFIKNSPISEAARGVVTVLDTLGVDVSDKNLNEIRGYFSQIPLHRYIDKVFEFANIKYVVMTNDPFDKIEQKVWNNGGNTDSRFKSALRIDNILNNFQQYGKEINNANNRR